MYGTPEEPVIFGTGLHNALTYEESASGVGSFYGAGRADVHIVYKMYANVPLPLQYYDDNNVLVDNPMPVITCTVKVTSGNETAKHDIEVHAEGEPAIAENIKGVTTDYDPNWFWCGTPIDCLIQAGLSALD